jgi:hypothetical protein
MDDDTQQLIDDCEARESRLDDWERGFLDSIKAQLAGGKALTERQAEKLGAIWDRVTARG